MLRRAFGYARPVNDNKKAWALIAAVSSGVITLAAVGPMACTDAGWGKLEALGDPAHVECWSGGQLIYRGRSTGKVSSEANSDGYYFRDAKTRQPMEVSGNCVITYGKTPGSAGSKPDAQ